MASVPAFQASGLASNLDTQGIIDKLVSIEGAPLSALAQKQAATSVKISSIGTLMSALETLGNQAKFLAKNGLSTISNGGVSYSDFTVAGAPANAGTYTVKVESLARAAKIRSTTVYNTADDVVTNSNANLKLSVDGTTKTIAVTAGTTLSQLVTQINGGDNPFTAALVSDGSKYYVTITNKDTGFVVGQPATSALAVVNENGIDQDLGLGLSSPVNLQATNAVAWVDGLRVERRKNELADVVPGTTLTLKAAGNTDTNLTFNADTGSSASMLNVFVNNYNKVVAFVKAQADIDPAAKRSGDKLGSGVVSNIQRSLENLIQTKVNATGSIRTLKDIGVGLQKDGTIALDATVLSAALAKDPKAVNAIFSTSTTGIGDLMSSFVKVQNDPTQGVLVSRRNGLNALTKNLTDQNTRINNHLTAFRKKLNIQFTALEEVMSKINNTAKFLDAQQAQAQKK